MGLLTGLIKNVFPKNTIVGKAFGSTRASGEGGVGILERAIKKPDAKKVTQPLKVTQGTTTNPLDTWQWPWEVKEKKAEYWAKNWWKIALIVIIPFAFVIGIIWIVKVSAKKASRSNGGGGGRRSTRKSSAPTPRPTNSGSSFYERMKAAKDAKAKLRKGGKRK